MEKSLMPRLALFCVSLLVFGNALSGDSKAPAAGPTVKAALGLTPVQPAVPYERVPSEDEAKCQIVDLDQGDWAGWKVLREDGTVLRRFADTNGDKKVDLWSYFSNGVEVYRDVDADFNGKADQYRWLGTAGTRWGLDEDEDGTIDRWKQISAEEVSGEVIAALAAAASPRFVRLLISPEELDGLGLEAAQAERIATKVREARQDFADFAARQEKVGKTAEWVQFAAALPGIVPAGTDGLRGDLMVYENAVAMFDQADRQGQVLVGTLVKVGDAWRLVDLPQVVGEEMVVSRSSGFFFTPDALPSEMGGGSSGEAAQRRVAELEQIDRQLAEAEEAAAQAELNARRADVVEQLVKAAEGEEERQTWLQQLVDTVAAAVQSGTYPEGVQRLEQARDELASDDPALQSYIGFQIISSEYARRLRDSEPDAFPEIQEWYLEALSRFVDEHPAAPEAAQAMMQLALSKEFEAKDEDAIAWYRKVTTAFPGQAAGEKAAGAIRRLESVGQRIDLSGTTLEGKKLQLARLRGNPVVVHYWATWCEPCKQDMKVLRQLQARYQGAGLQIVGVNVDGRRADAEAYLQANPQPWPQLFDEGGLESSDLAIALGVQTLPTMLLLDDKGQVVRHNVQTVQLDREIGELVE